MKMSHCILRLCGTLLLLAVVAVSCTEEIDFSSALEKKVVVNLILENRDTQELTLCYNSRPGAYRYEYVKEADVRLFDDMTEIGRFGYDGLRTWTLNFRPLAGHTYRLSVNVPGYDEITAVTTMPENVRVQIQRDRWPSTVDHKITDRHKYFTQSEAEDPYWIWVMYRKSPRIGTGETVSIEAGDVIERSIGSDHIALDNFNVEDYLVFSDVYGPVGESLSHPAYLRIGRTDESLEYPIIFFIEANLDNSIVAFRAASPEYDEYLKSSLIKAFAYEAEDDFTSYFEENVVYSNINGGLGIFAACSDTLIARSTSIDSHWLSTE